MPKAKYGKSKRKPLRKRKKATAKKTGQKGIRL